MSEGQTCEAYLSASIYPWIELAPFNKAMCIGGCFDTTKISN